MFNFLLQANFFRPISLRWKHNFKGMYMLIVIWICFIIAFSLLCFCYVLSMAENIYLNSGLRLHELTGINTYTKREFNLKPPKNITKSVIIEKCGNVNNIWKGSPYSTKIDVTEWSIVFAIDYISNSKLKFNYCCIDLIKLKWKYRDKYLLIKFIKR